MANDRQKVVFKRSDFTRTNFTEETAKEFLGGTPQAIPQEVAAGAARILLQGMRDEYRRDPNPDGFRRWNFVREMYPACSAIIMHEYLQARKDPRSVYEDKLLNTFDFDDIADTHEIVEG